MVSKSLGIAALALVLLVTATVPATAQAPDRIVRVGGVYLNPLGESEEERDLYALTLEADTAVAPFVEFEFSISPSTGLAISASTVTLDIEGVYREQISTGNPLDPFREETLDTTGELDATPITLGLHYHLSQRDDLDFYIGGQLAYVLFDDLELDQESLLDKRIGQRVFPLEDDFAWGALIGVDWKVGDSENWVISGAAQYLPFAAEVDQPGADNNEYDIDPWMVRLGVGYSF
jgi:outer membrane protein W